MPEFDYVDEESGAPAGDVPVVDSRATIGRAAGFRDAAAIVTGAIPDLADSVLSSVTKLTPLPDFERGSLTRQVPFAKENLKAAEAASGTLGILAESLIAPELTALKQFDRVVKGSKTLRAITASNRQVDEAFRRVATADKILAEQGLEGKKALDASIAGIRRDKVANAARIQSAKRTLTQGVATEALIGVTLYENEFAVPDHSPATLGAFAALGIGIPLGFDQIAAGAAMRRHLQSDAVRLARATALDAGSGVENIRENITKGAFKGAATTKPVDRVESGLPILGRFADEAALEALQLYARETPIENTTLGLNRKNAASGNLQRAQEALTQITTRGNPEVRGSGFSMLGVDEGNAARQTMLDLIRQNPVALQGLEFVQRLPEGVTIEDSIKAFDAGLDRREQRAMSIMLDPKSSPEQLANAQALMGQTYHARQLVPVVIDRGELHPAARYANRGPAFDGVIDVTSKPVGGLQAKGGAKANQIYTAKQTGLALDTGDATITLPKGKTLSNLSFQETESLYALGRKFMDSAVTNRQFHVDSKASWFHLDMAETLLREKPYDVQVVFPQGMTREQAMVESFAQKAEMLRAQRGSITVDSLDTWRRKLNLPGLTELQLQMMQHTTPAESLIFGGLSGNDIRKLSLSDLRKAAGEARRMKDSLVAVGPEEMDILGTSLVTEGSPFIRGPNKPAIEPVLAWRRELGKSIFDSAAIENRQMENLTESLAHLVSPNASPTVRNLSSVLMQDADAAALTDLSRLDDTLQVASIGNNRIRQGLFSNQSTAAAGNQTLLAAQRIFRKASAFMEQDYDRFIRKTVTSNGKTLERIIGDIQRSENTKSRLLVEQFIQARRGFQLDGVIVKGPDGFHEFRLKDTRANRRQYELVTGRTMPPKATLPLLSGKSLGVDDAALETIQAFDTIAGKLRSDSNTILRAAGIREIGVEPFYIPASQSPFNAFVLDSNNEAIRMVAAKTAEQRDSLISKLRSDPKSILNTTPGAKIYTQEKIERELPLLNRAQNDFLDPSIPYASAVKGSERSGAAASPFTLGNSVSDVAKAFRNNHNANTRRVLEVMFKPQLDEARVRSVIAAGKDKGNKLNRFSGEPVAGSAANTYINSLLGRRAIDSPSSPIGKIFNPIEGFLNIGLRNGYSLWSSVGGRTLEPGQLRKEFDAAVQQLGDRTPFTSGAALLEERNLFKTPPDIAAFSATFNDLATRLMLRYDSAHAVINMAGIITTFPAVASSVLPRVGESYADVAARFGRDADIFVSSNGKSFGAWSVMKAAAESIRYMLNPASHKYYELAQRYGGLDAAVAEMHKQLGQVHDTKTWKVMARKADKYAGFISDKSEQMAVAWSLFTAERLLAKIGISDDIARFSVARQLVDESIANFSPLNRPQIFQSPGVGSALGLFQTYMFNYYSRLFGYIENRQYKTLAIQGAMQAAVFGTQTIPGMTQYNNLVFEASGGKEDPISGLYDRFSLPMADALFYGTPSTLSLMFGLDRDSTPAISSRGSVDVRVPGSTQLPAGLNVIKNIYTGVADGIELFSRQNAGITDQQVGEVLQRHVMNRPMSALISMFWTDALVDSTGNKIAEETSTALGGIWRAMGFRTVAQSAQIEAYARFRGAEALRLQRRAQLSESMRAIFRDGSFDETKAERAMSAFIRTGGTPQEFVSFLKSAAESGLMTETERALISQLANEEKIQSRWHDIVKLYNATHSTSVFDEESSSE